MIRRVWSDLPTFNTVAFEAGFNVVLAETAEDSKETESTNGLGKTTLVRIILRVRFMIQRSLVMIRQSESLKQNELVWKSH